MKNILILITGMFLFSCQPAKDNQAASDTGIEIASENLGVAKFRVTGMTCTGCEKSVEKRVMSSGGIGAVEASHVDSTTIVKFDKTLTDIARVANAIESAGYKVEPVLQND